jgi:WD40 repeat protein
MATMKQIGDPLQGHTDSVVSVAVHDGKIVSGSDYETIRVWNMVSMKQPLQGHIVNSVATIQGVKQDSECNFVSLQFNFTSFF